jgi:exodeoxyribonuclease VIII
MTEPREQWHIMYDLETMSTQTRAVIFEIGMTWFRLDGQGDMITDSFSVRMEEQLENGAHFDPQTLAWWLEQSQGAREAAAHHIKTGLPISQVLSAMTNRIELNTDPLKTNRDLAGVWGNGATFDITILESAYERASRKAPWKYRIVRDTRTINALINDLFGKEVSEDLFVKSHMLHSGSADAMAQAKWMQNCHGALKDQAGKLDEARWAAAGDRQ